MIVQEKQKKEAHSFYAEALKELNECGAPFMIGGAFALAHYTGIHRDTKDLDIFCRPADCTRIVKHFANKGYQTEFTDARWLAKVLRNEYYIDIIFDTPNNICTVNDTWFEHASKGEFAGHEVLILPAEELVWCKIYVQNRDRYDGADVNHVFLRHGKHLNWSRLKLLFNAHWHLLLAQILSFQFVYPADSLGIVPSWLFDELIQRAKDQYEMPPALERVCRGPIIDQAQYSIDIKEWNFKVYTMKTV